MWYQKSNFAKNNTMLPTIQYIRKELMPSFTREETESLIRLIFSQLKNYSLTDLVLRENDPLTATEITEIKNIVDRLKHHEPIQYILGTTQFYGINLEIKPGVLIPRPETEELVDWILRSEQAALKILDIGTGSGCIALALKKHLSAANVQGCDLSPDALALARKNAENSGLDVAFLLADILAWQNQEWPETYDIIVSNPPYVREKEALAMKRNVLEYDPHSALFVPDVDPLIFYINITDFALTHLKSGGKLYFEINENFGNEMVNLLSSKGFQDVTIKKDMQGKNRMARGTWPGSKGSL
jgi:release factor glutamine methyltransferase